MKETKACFKCGAPDVGGMPEANDFEGAPKKLYCPTCREALREWLKEEDTRLQTFEQTHVDRIDFREFDVEDEVDDVVPGRYIGTELGADDDIECPQCGSVDVTMDEAPEDEEGYAEFWCNTCFSPFFVEGYELEVDEYGNFSKK